MGIVSNSKKGFTIVELLIVIVVIAILATISVVAYNGIQQRAHESSHARTMKAWQKLFEVYKAGNGQYPPSIDKTLRYCLGGDEFPIGYTGVPSCHEFMSSSNNVPASRSSTLMSELETAGSLPTGVSRVGWVVGPYLGWSSSGNYYRITSMFKNGCPDGFIQQWGNTNQYWCELRLYE